MSEHDAQTAHHAGHEQGPPLSFASGDPVTRVETGLIQAHAYAAMDETVQFAEHFEKY